MDEDYIKRGERVGAAIVFWLTFPPCCLMCLASVVDLFSGASRFSGTSSIDKIFVVITVLPFAGVSIWTLTAAGSLLGKAAAKCQSVKSAFLWGAFLSGPTILCLIFILLLPFFIFSHVDQFTRKDLIPLFFVLTIISAFGSFISGLAAIYVRDYRQFQRKRWIPQFTLQEIFIVFTIISVIISAMTTLAVLP
jgi:hypothetical protein